MRTLEQKFEEVIEDAESLTREDRCAMIADEHAIDFAKWVLSWAAPQCGLNEQDAIKRYYEQLNDKSNE